MKTTTTKTTNALLHKNGEFIVKDQIIFQYPKAITTRQVKAQVKYLLGKKATTVPIAVKQLDKHKHIFLIAGLGVHNWGPETVGKLTNPKPVPPIPPPIIPNISTNTVIIQQNGLKNNIIFKTNIFKTV